MVISEGTKVILGSTTPVHDVVSLMCWLETLGDCTIRGARVYIATERRVGQCIDVIVYCDIKVSSVIFSIIVSPAQYYRE